MKKLLATTALVALVSGPAFAQETTEPVDDQATTNEATTMDNQTDPAATDMQAEPEVDEAASADQDNMFGNPAYMANDMELRASDFLGRTIYTREGGVAAEDADALSARTDVTDPADDWENLGEIEDVLISPEGTVDTVIAGVGGFLDMGDRSVRISMDDLAFVPDGDDEGEFFVVYKGDAAVLGEGDAYEEETAYGEGYRSARAESGLMETDVADYTAEDLEGASVYGSNDERIGEVGKLILGEDGKVTDAVIDVGGFLGIGEKHVALSFDELRLMRTENDETPRVYVGMTQEELENLPEYEE